MHIAESLEEREWLEKGTGPFQAVFEKLGVPSNAPRASIMETIEWLASFQRAMLIHGNYLTLNEIERVAESEISVVFCPRTHLHFGHSTYPLTAMTKAGR